MQHVAICDDSREYREFLVEMIYEAKKERQMEIVIYEYASGKELLDTLDKGIPYDLLILDMQLEDMDGDEIAARFREKYSETVLAFCSGYCQPTVESFKATPFRYMLKQQPRKVLLQTIGELLDEIKKGRKNKFLIAHYRSIQKKIDIEDIIYIEIAKRGGRLVLRQECKEVENGEKLLVDKKPEQLLIELEPYGFALAQTSYLVNVNHIIELRTEDCLLCNGEIMKIARSYQKSIKVAFRKLTEMKY